MVDREKVIQGLGRISEWLFQQYRVVYDGDAPNYYDAYKTVDEAIELLKEQEAVAPVMVPHSRGIAYKCGSCGTEIAVIRDTVSADWQKNSVRFCQRCGRSVKW